MTSSDFARMKKPCLSSSERAVEGWLHYSPQDQTNFSSEGLTKSPFFAVMREYNVVLGFFLVSSIFLKVCSTCTMYVPVETVNS